MQCNAIKGGARIPHRRGRQHTILSKFQKNCMKSVADPGFPRGGGANSPGGGHQHTILPIFPKNCMKLKEFGPHGGGGAHPKFYYVDPPLEIVKMFGRSESPLAMQGKTTKQKHH